MELKPGYKQTEVGVIPDDWDVSTVGREFEIKLGKMLDGERNTGVPKPYLGNKAVQWGRINLDDLPTVPMTRADIYSYRLREGDLLVCEGGEVGRAAIWHGPIDECYYQKAIHRLRALHGFEPSLMVGLLRRWADSGRLANYVTKTSIAHLPREKFLAITMPVPPQAEQRLISQVLCDLDALVAQLDGLIAKKRNIKQAAMQELLTGKRRLPGFEGEWEVKRLGEHVKFLRNGVNSRAELHLEGSIKYLHYGDIHASADSFLSPQHLPCLPGAKAARLDRLRNGDLIFADASEDIAGVSRSVEILGACESEVVSGLHTIAARFDKTFLADGFKGFLQYVPSFYAHLRRLAAGTKVYATNRAHILCAEVRLPPVAEQKAIASVLIDMSNELGLLRDRMNKVRSTKQGMMQQLLTGKIRLT